MRIFLLYIFAAFCLPYQLFSQDNPYKIIYEADKDGNAISGSLSDLLDYVQNGNPVRVGWVLMMQTPNSEVIEMQHWTDAGFITTLDGHVFAQIEGIFQQGPGIMKPPSVFLTSEDSNSWVAILGTTGVMRQKFKRSSEMVEMLKKTMNDQEIEEFFKEQETLHVHTKWAVLNR